MTGKKYAIATPNSFGDAFPDWRKAVRCSVLLYIHPSEPNPRGQIEDYMGDQIGDKLVGINAVWDTSRSGKMIHASDR